MKKILFITLILCSNIVFGQTKHLVKNGVIVKSGIPEKFTRNDGTFYWGGYQNLPDSIHYSDGWRDEVRPVINSALQSYGQRYYNAAMDKVTWVVIDNPLPTLEEAKTAKIKELREAVKGLYSDIQWVAELYRSNGDAIPTVVGEKIKTIRTKYIQFKNYIESQTTVIDVLQIVIPYDQIETIRAQLDDIY